MTTVMVIVTEFTSNRIVEFAQKVIIELMHNKRADICICFKETKSANMNIFRKDIFSF